MMDADLNEYFAPPQGSAPAPKSGPTPTFFPPPLRAGRQVLPTLPPPSVHSPGTKLDDGKPRLGLVFMTMARALQEVGEVATFGANEYSDDGWLSVPDGERRYTHAMFRHLMEEAVGNERDAKSKLRHAAHTAWNALARLDLMIRREEGTK